MEIKVHTEKKYDVVDVTLQVADIVQKADIQEGLCSVYVPHATAAMIVNEKRRPSDRTGFAECA